MKTKEELSLAIDTIESMLKTSKFLEAKELANELLELNTIQEHKDLFAQVNNHLGLIYKNLSDFNFALEYFKKSLMINEQIENFSGIISNLSNIGNVYNILSDYPKAIEFYDKALILTEQIGNTISRAVILGNIGIVYYNLMDYENAFNYYKKSLRIQEENGDKAGIARNLGNIGVVYTMLSDYPNALEYYSKSLIINEEIGNKVGMATDLGNIGSVYKHLSDFEKAIEYFEKALSIQEKIEDKEGITHNLGSIGRVYKSLGNHSLAIEYLNKAYFLSIEIGIQDVTMETLKEFSELYEQNGDTDKALSYYKQYIKVKDELQSEEAKKQAQQFDQRRKVEEDEKNRQVKLARFQEQERIFHNILPITIANRLIDGETSIAESYENVSIFFSDIVGFTALSSIIPPKKLVNGLNQIFTAFDRIATKYGLEKIKTIGDAYMAVCGVPNEYDDHAIRTSHFALEVLESIKNIKLADDFSQLSIRIGLHSGPVVAGIIGEKKFAFDVWGDSVNIASRMESHGESGRVHCSEAFAKLLNNNRSFHLTPRGEITIKGKGSMNTFWLEKRK